MEQIAAQGDLSRGRVLIERLKRQYGDCGAFEDRLDLGRLRRERYIDGSGFGAVANFQGRQDGGDRSLYFLGDSPSFAMNLPLPRDTLSG